jgi:uncharacterized protein
LNISNKTPKAKDVVTESAPKKSKTRYLIVTALAFLVIVAILSFYNGQNKQNSKIDKNTPKVLDTACPIKLPSDQCIYMEIADTYEKRVQGLSGRDNLDENRGLLFVFDAPGKQCIWMKDMKFSIDILWLNSDKVITAIERDISPDTYPKSFCPSDDSKYVIELNSGIASKANLEVGKQLNL